MANSIEEAQEAVIRDHMNPSFGWQLDEGNHHEAYIPDSDDWEEVEDGLGRLYGHASHPATPAETERKNK